MRSIKIRYQNLIFLYAYLRQIDLSLDRSRWQKWIDLKNYYSTQINASKVSDKLQEFLNLHLTKHSFSYCSKPPSFWRSFSSFFQKKNLKTNYLTDTEILYCCQLLNRFDALLKRDYSEYPLEAESLRIEIAKFYSNVLEHKLYNRDLRRAIAVEHFMQSDMIKVFGMKEFVTEELSG